MASAAAGGSSRILAALGAALLSLSVCAADSFRWEGPEGPVWFEGRGELEEFLSDATILEAETIEGTAARPIKVLLEKDGIRLNAVFRHLESFRHRWNSPDGLKINYRDSALFESALYRLASLLDLPHIPPTVLRALTEEDFADPSLIGIFPRSNGSMQAWVENAMTERTRRKRNRQPPDYRLWGYQLQLMLVLDTLVSNDDRNLGNILIDRNWKLWFIDATRAFRRYEDLIEPEKITRCERGLWRRLQTVGDDEITERLSGVLRGAEIRTLLKRRARLVDYLQSRIDRWGEEGVLFDLPFEKHDPTAKEAAVQAVAWR